MSSSKQQALPADYLTKKWEEDSTIDPHELSDAVTRNINMHSFYVGQKVLHLAKKRKLLSEKEEVEKTQMDWLKGRLKVNGRTFPYNLSAEELKIYRNAHPDVQKLNEKIEAANITIGFLDDVIKNIGQRSFEIRALIDLRKLEAGW